MLEWEGLLNTSGAAALAMDHTAFFATPSGVLFYSDKMGWGSRDLVLSPIQASMGDSVRLYPDLPDKGLIACTRAGDVWRYAADKWDRVDSPPTADGPGAEAAPSVLGLVCTQAGIWRLSARGLNFKAWGEADKTTDDLIRDLDDGKFSVREAATQALLVQGPSILPLLTRQLAAHQDAESKYRLQFILDQVRRGSATVAAPVTLGNFTVSGPVFLSALPDGTALVGATSITPAGVAATRPSMVVPVAPGPAFNAALPAGPAGILAIAPDGAVTLRGGPELLAAFLRSNARFQQPMAYPLQVIPGTSLAWLTASGSSPRLTLVDLATGKVVRQIDSPFAQALPLAADRQILFFRTNSGFIVFRPDVPDAAKPLPVAYEAPLLTNAPTALAQTDDGAVWFTTKEGLTRYDGKSARIIPGTERLGLAAAVPGTDGLLCTAANRWYLATTEGVTEGDLLEDFIQQHHDAFAKKFAGPRHAVDRRSLYVQADKAGNIWMVNAVSRQLKVLTGDRWIDTAQALAQAGDRSGHISVLFAVGDGSQVYLADDTTQVINNATAPVTAFLATCDQGKLQLTPAPRLPLGNGRGTVAWPDSHGDVWINTPLDRWIDGAAVRLTASGADKPIDGRVMAVDAADDVWLRRTNSLATGTPIALWHAGTIHKVPAFPFMLLSQPPLPFSDGRLFVPTDIGLLEIRSGGTADHPTFTPGSLYRLADPRDNFTCSFAANMLYRIEYVTGRGNLLRFYVPAS